MPQLKRIFILIVLFNFVTQSVQLRNELPKLLNDSIRRKQELKRWLTQTRELLKSRFEMIFSNDHISYEDAIMFIHLIHEIRRLYEKLTSPPVYWYSRMG
jgi:hypothetical protein